MPRSDMMQPKGLVSLWTCAWKRDSSVTLLQVQLLQERRNIKGAIHKECQHEGQTLFYLPSKRSYCPQLSS